LSYRSLTVTIDSDCDHWVVYDEPLNSICVEPQSAPPDAVRLGLATTLPPHTSLTRSMSISWAAAARTGEEAM
jgi:aldose 1-epimerase